jgi:beta-glucanase (GH16 family)
LTIFTIDRYYYKDMKIKIIFFVIICAVTLILTACATAVPAVDDEKFEIPEGWETEQPGSRFIRIERPVIFNLKTPEAGNFPQSLYNYPYRIDNNAWLEPWTFTQTIDWYPPIERAFLTNTQYTARITLNPVDSYATFRGTAQDDIRGFPTSGVESITGEIVGERLRIYITFEKTGSENTAPKLIFEDNFEGNFLDRTKWDNSPEWDRQGRSSWRNDMVSVSDGLLRLGLRLDPELGAAKSPNNAVTANNWIRAGAVQTQRANSGRIFESSYGFWEASIRFPQVPGTWGAFWLMCYTIGDQTSSAVMGTEIDILESIGNAGNTYNFAIHWNYHGPAPGTSASIDFNPNRGHTNIYDGEFHVFALEWNPSEYIFYINGEEYWRVRYDARHSRFGILRNPAYIILSVEAANWDQALPAGFFEDEMLVEWVRVWNQPKID